MIGGKSEEPLGNLDGVVDLLLKNGATLLLLHSRLLHSRSTHHTGLLHSGSTHHHTGLLHTGLLQLHTGLLHLHASRTRRRRSALHLLRCGRLLAVETIAGGARRCGCSRRSASTRRGLHHMGLTGRGRRTAHATAGGLLGRECLERSGGGDGWRTGRWRRTAAATEFLHTHTCMK